MLTATGITWHDKESKEPIVQLGYPMYSSQSQLDIFLDKLKSKIKSHADMLKERRLSIRGAAMMANSVVLSKHWHILRVIKVPKLGLKNSRSLCVHTYFLSGRDRHGTPCATRKDMVEQARWTSPNNSTHFIIYMCNG